MANEEKVISNISYVGKDFRSIYPEMLSLAKELTNKWDPTTSNESDPGVVLLKEGAFVADHNNYNIDKNILEAFLPSATQDKSVRDIVETNGYVPRYYISASGVINITYNPDKEVVDETSETTTNSDVTLPFTIPAFTLTVTDADQTVTYTQIESINIEKEGVAAAGTFVEGTIQELTANQSNIITLDNLDSNNRIYFPTAMVASNGIYIRYNNDADNDTYGYWTRENYLSTMSNGSRVYKMDYDSRKGLPYIEFPSDISNIINDGLNIKYLTTSGSAGNISARGLVNIVNPSEITLEDETVSTSKFTVSNQYAIMNGKDPETIDEMYKSFKKVVGTFDTLVTCRDYSNKIYELAEDEMYGTSNCYVADRRIDFNKAANVITTDADGLYFKSLSIKPCKLAFKGEVENYSILVKKLADPGDMYYVLNSEGNNSKGLYINTSKVSTASWVHTSYINLNDFSILTAAMTPFDLVIYALKRFSISDYDPYLPNQALAKSFKKLETSNNPSEPFARIKTALNKTKCISHNYNDPTSGDIICFKNYCPVKATITPYVKVSLNERNEILNNVYIALSNNFNARKVEFGTALDKTSIEAAIKAADERIRDVNVLPLEYIPKALYYDNEEKDITETVSSSSESSTIIMDVIAKNVLAGRVCLFDFDDDFTYRYGQQGVKKNNKDITIMEEVSSISSEAKITVKEANKDSATVESSDAVVSKYTYTSKYDDVEENKLVVYYIFNAPNFSTTATEDKKSTRKNLGIGMSYTLTGDDTLTIKVVKDKKTLSSAVYKSHENCTYTVTNKLLYEDGNVDYLLNNRSDGQEEYIERNGDIAVVEERTNNLTTDEGENLNYTLKKNEYIQIMNPNYYSDSTYGLYVNVRYIDSKNRTIKANTEHTLLAGQYLKLMYTKDSVQTVNEIGPGSIIKTTFDLVPTDTIKNGSVYKSWTDVNGGYHDNDKFITLASNQSISTRKLLQTILSGSTTYCYWITNTKIDNHSCLFMGKPTRILEEGEYFVYTNSNKDEVMILGSGTKLETKNCGSDRWTLSTTDISIESLSEGNSEINWMPMNLNGEDNQLAITEMSILTLGENDNITITGWVRTEEEKKEQPDWAIDNTWRTCNGTIQYTLNDNTIILPKVEDFYTIRSRLDIVANPEDYQEILQDNNCKQSITVMYKDGTAVLNDNKYRLQASQYLSLIGNDKIDLSYYSGYLKLYYYTLAPIYYKYIDSSKESEEEQKIIEEASNGDDEYAVNFNKKEKGNLVFPFYFNGKKLDDDNYREFIFPIFMSNNNIPVKLKIYKTFNFDEWKKEFSDPTAGLSDEVEIKEYNITKDVGAEPGLTLNDKATFLVTIDKNYIPASGELYLNITWDTKAVESQLLVLYSYEIVQGLNKALASTNVKLDDVLRRIREIVDGSDCPSTKPYYIYTPENSMAIERPNFSDPNTFWDKNNVANYMTIPQVEIVTTKDTSGEYYIDIDKSMRNYEW